MAAAVSAGLAAIVGSGDSATGTSFLPHSPTSATTIHKFSENNPPRRNRDCRDESRMP